MKNKNREVISMMHDEGKLQRDKRYHSGIRK